MGVTERRRKRREGEKEEKDEEEGKEENTCIHTNVLKYIESNIVPSWPFLFFHTIRVLAYVVEGNICIKTQS